VDQKVIKEITCSIIKILATDFINDYK